MDTSLSLSGAGESASAELAHSNSVTPTTLVTATPVAPATVPVELPQAMGLKPRQRVALQALADGLGPWAASQRAGISPQTLHRWRKRDPHFIAALNAWRAQTQEAAHDTLVAAVRDAAQTVRQAALHGDVRASLAVLKGIGVLEQKPVGTQSATQAARELAVETGLARAASGRRHGPRKISLHLLEQIFEHMDVDDATLGAYRTAFAQHRAAIAQRRSAPLLRPVTPEALQKSAEALMPARGRAFKYVAEPTLTEYLRYMEAWRQVNGQQPADDGDEDDDDAPQRPDVHGLPPAMPAFPPRYCSIIIVAAGSDPKALARRLMDAEGTSMETALQTLQKLPHKTKNDSPSDLVEAHAREFEQLGATVEIRPVYSPSTGDLIDEHIAEMRSARETRTQARPGIKLPKGRRSEMQEMAIFNKMLDQLMPDLK